MNRHSRVLLTILILAAVLIPTWLSRRSVPDATESTATSRSGGGTPVQPVRGGTLTASTRSEPRSFNRLVSRALGTELVSFLTQGRLVRLNRATQELEPWLAERWDLAPDGRSYTLKLREGVTWSDGTAFTAADVLFTFEAIYDPAARSVLASGLRVGDEPFAVTASNDHSVVLTFPEVMSAGLRLLDSVVILPKHKLEAALRAGKFADAWSAATPPSELVGLGPFTLARYEPGQRLVFDRNPRYWRTNERGEPLPYLDHFVIEIVPDEDAEVVRLQSGQIDFTQTQLRPGDIAPMRQLAEQGRLHLIDLGVSPDPDSFFFNLRPEQWSKDPRAAWLPRKEFRQAISHAIDREAFANTVYLGEAVPVRGPITPGNKRWFWPNVPRYEYSREKALALFGQIGLRNRDADEWLEDAQGTEARFTVQTFRGNTMLERSAAVLKDDLRAVGLAVDIVALDAPTVTERLTAGQFEAMLISFTASDHDPAVNKDYWLSSGSAHVWNVEQKTPATDWERQIDELMVKQGSTLDEDERTRLFQEVQRIFAEQLPVIHVVSPRIYLATSPRVVNPTPSVTRPLLLWSVDTLAAMPGATTTQ